MKAKFYKGSYHGKTMEVRPDEVLNGVRIAKIKGPLFATMMDADSPVGESCIEQEHYEIMMMSVTLNGHTYYAPAMHPDGSIFLVKRS